METPCDLVKTFSLSHHFILGHDKIEDNTSEENNDTPFENTENSKFCDLTF